jgi:CHAT domain-containing protein/Tfp pilus assembly protein PilF
LTQTLVFLNVEAIQIENEDCMRMKVCLSVLPLLFHTTLLMSQVSSSHELEKARLTYQTLHDSERYEEAQEAGRRWIDLAEKAGNLKEVAEAHVRTARSFAAQRKFAPAIPHYQKALEQLTALGNHELWAAALIDLATAEANLARYDDALSNLSQAETSLKETSSPVQSARLWSVRATVAVYRNEAYEALPLFERAHEFAAQTTDEKLLGTILINWGQAHMVLHRYADAMALYQRALETALPSTNRMIVLGSIGICHYEMNQFTEARGFFDQALQLAVKVGSPNLEAWALGELGLTAWKSEGNAERATDYFDKSIALYEKSGDQRNALTFMANKAVTLRDNRQYMEALKLYRDVERRMLLIPGQKPTPAVYRGIGESLAGLGRLDEAEDMLRRAVAVAQEAGDTRRIWEANQGLARLYERQERLAEADQAYQNALNAIESQRDSLRVGGFKTDFFEDKVRVYEEYAAFLIEHFGAEQGPRHAFEVAERARARSLLDSLAESRAAIEETLPPEVWEKEKAILSEISSLQSAIRRGEGNPDQKRVLTEREKDLRDFYVRVRSEHPRFRRMRYPEPARLDEVQNSLRHDEALLEYMVGDGVSYLWFISRDRMRFVQLPGGDLTAVVRARLAQLVRADSEADLEAVAEFVLRPVERVENLPKSLIIVPSGILHYLPFEALPSGAAREPLNAMHAVSYVPSATVLVTLRSSRPANVSPRLLAVADSIYSQERAESAARSAAASNIQNLGSLPHTRREVQSIRSAFGALSSTVLIGEGATEGNLKTQDLSRYSVLHLATHGWIDSRFPSRSGLILGVEPGSGEDGILEVREIFRLSLRANLVTLSACQSGLGKLITGEGMSGLTHAFFYAGAPSVVATLWSVSDEATAEFMASFYRYLGRGESKTESLRLARQELSSNPKYRHPYYWAAYILIGEGADTVPFPGNTWVWILGAAALLMAAGAAVLYRKASRSRR